MIKTTCKQDITKWHRWWAWYPVYFTEYKDDRICTTKVWFEYVEQRYVYSYGDGWWKYRMIGDLSDQA